MPPTSPQHLRLESLLRREVAPHLKAKAEARILDLACGRCDEAETLISVVKDRSRRTRCNSSGLTSAFEVRQARERTANLDTEFLIGRDQARRAERMKDFDMVFLRHPELLERRRGVEKNLRYGAGQARRRRPARDRPVTSTRSINSPWKPCKNWVPKSCCRSATKSRARSATGRTKAVNRWLAVLETKVTKMPSSLAMPRASQRASF